VRGGTRRGCLHLRGPQRLLQPLTFLIGSLQLPAYRSIAARYPAFVDQDPERFAQACQLCQPQQAFISSK